MFLTNYKQLNNKIMNENLNLVEILKDCPEGTKLYSTVFGDVIFVRLTSKSNLPICIKNRYSWYLTSDGKLMSEFDGECTLFPSKEQRDWSKFHPKNPKFDPKTLQPFDRVLVRDNPDYKWVCHIFSHYNRERANYVCIGGFSWKCCIPYGDETKHLVGTKDEAPEFYRYWED